MKNERRLRGITQVCLAGFGFGFLGIFGKLAFQRGFTVGELLSCRFLCAATLLWLGVLTFQPRLIKASWREVLVCAFLGIFGYAVFASLYFGAIQGVSASLAALLLYTYPALVTVGAAVFLKENPGPKGWLALPLASLGLGILLWGETRIDSWLSVLMGFAAAACYASYILLSSRLQKNISPLTSGLYVITFASLGLFVFHRPNLHRVLEFTILDWSLIFSLAVVCTIGPMILFLAGLQKLGNSQASLLSTVEPLTAAIFAGLILKERLTPLQLGGGVLIISALALTALAKPDERLTSD